MGNETYTNGEVQRLTDMVTYQVGAVVSRAILNRATGSVTLFAFDTGQELSEHTSPFDALVVVVEGVLSVAIAGASHQVGEGELLVLPANQPHSVHSVGQSKMLLVMLRGQDRHA